MSRQVLEDKIIGDSEHAVSYYPEAREMWAGSEVDIAFMRNGLGGGWLAGMEGILDPVEDRREIGYTQAGLNTRPALKFTEVDDRLIRAKQASAELNLLRRQAMRGLLTPQMAAQMRSAQAELSSHVIPQITIVPFVQRIIGMITSYNVISRAFTHIPANNLRGKIPEGGWPGVNVQVKRLQEPNISHTDYGQTEFRIRRNEIHLYINREDRMEATIDPLAYSMTQAQQQMMQIRDLMALKALSGATTNPYVTFPGSTNSIGSNGRSAFPRAIADASSYFLDVQQNQFTHWRHIFKYIITNPLDYRVIETNYYNRNKVEPNPLNEWGIGPFVGLERYGTVSITSPWVPRNRAYFVGTEGAYELDGPKVVDAEYDSRKFADYYPIRDFVGYHLAHPQRFVSKVELNIEGVTTGAEITTDKQIETMLAPPEAGSTEGYVVSKSDDA